MGLDRIDHVAWCRTCTAADCVDEIQLGLCDGATQQRNSRPGDRMGCGPTDALDLYDTSAARA
jgi:hypothetical protein